MSKRRIALISTGGTIEKTYNAMEGILHNETSVLDILLARLTLGGVHIVRIPLLNKDSLELSEVDHTLIATTAGSMAAAHDGVIIVHGTDSLARSGDRIVDVLGEPRVPIVLTGAMHPYVLRNTDSVQNMTEALLAVQILPSGVYVALHNKVLRFPGVTKDRERGTFVGGEEV